MEDETTKYNLRLPTELYKRIARKAKEQDRSTNRQIVVMLRDWFIARGGEMDTKDLLRILKDRLDRSGESVKKG